jgi:hypothetical protein
MATIPSLQLPSYVPATTFDFATPLDKLSKIWTSNADADARQTAMQPIADQLRTQGKITDFSSLLTSRDPSLIKIGQDLYQKQQEAQQTAVTQASLDAYRKATLAQTAASNASLDQYRKATIANAKEAADQDSWKLVPEKTDEFGGTTPAYLYNPKTTETKAVKPPGAPDAGNDLYSPQTPAVRGPSPFPSVGGGTPKPPGPQSSLVLPPSVASANASMDMPPPAVAPSPSALSSLASLVTPTAAQAAEPPQPGQPASGDTSFAARFAQPPAAPQAAPQAAPGWANAQTLATQPADFQDKVTDPIQPPAAGDRTINDFKTAVQRGVTGGDLYNYLPTLVRNRVQGMIEGRVQASGTRNKQVQALINIASTIDPDFTDASWKARSTMWNDLAKSNPASLGGALMNGEAATGHLAAASDNLVKIHNRAGPDIPGGQAIGQAWNTVANKLATPEQGGILTGAENLLHRYGGESQKFYAGTPGTEGERKHAETVMNPRSSTSLDQAAYLESENDLMMEKYKAAEDHVRTTMGDSWLQKHPVITPQVQERFNRVKANIATLRGGASADSGDAAPVAGKPGNYTINGKNVSIVPVN